MTEIQIADVWLLFKEYIDRKNLDVVAERFVELLADHGVSEKVLTSVVGHDDYLDDAIGYYLDDNIDEDVQDDWFDKDDD